MTYGHIVISSLQTGRTNRIDRAFDILLGSYETTTTEITETTETTETTTTKTAKKNHILLQKYALTSVLQVVGIISNGRKNSLGVCMCSTVIEKVPLVVKKCFSVMGCVSRRKKELEGGRKCFPW